MTASPSSGRLSDKELAEMGDMDPAGPRAGGEGVLAGENLATGDPEDTDDRCLFDGRFGRPFLPSGDTDRCPLRLNPDPEWWCLDLVRRCFCFRRSGEDDL